MTDSLIALSKSSSLTFLLDRLPSMTGVGCTNGVASGAGVEGTDGILLSAFFFSSHASTESLQAL